jgi:hypothetical protein
MALVRRTAVDGRQNGPAAPAPSGLTVPRQPSAADIDEAGAASAPPPVEEMAAAPDRPPRLWVVLIALLLVAAGAAAAVAIDDAYAVPTMPVASDAAAIVVVILFAAVVERLVEPLTRWMPGRRAQFRYEQQIADLANRVPQVSLGSVAAAKAAVAQRRAEKALLSWGLATGLATVLAAAAGFHLLRILVETDGPAWGVVPVWVDALATGLVVGTSTKPVHDLLTRMQQAIALRRDPTGA